MADELLEQELPVAGEATLDVAIDPPDDDIQVEVADDRPPEDRRPSPAIEAEHYDPDADPENDTRGVRTKKRFSQLKWQAHEERRRADAVERQLAAAIDYTQRLQSQYEGVRKTAVLGQRTAYQAMTAKAEAEIAKAEREYREGMETGDIDKQLAAQKVLISAQTQRSQLGAMAEPTDAMIPQAPQFRMPQSTELPERTMRWKSENQWFGQHKLMTAHALAVHADLVERGVPADSEKYYEALDNEVRKRFPEQFATQQAQAAPARKPAATVAPVVRVSPGGKRTVTLTASQAAIADRLGVPHKDYAKQLLMENN